MTPAVWTAALLLAGILPAQETKKLKVGDPAPALDVAHWIKGDAVTTFQPGQAYVVEFWATWCPPCKTSMPHLTELQKELGDKIVIIGLSDEKLDVAKGFLDKPEWAEKTQYTMGTDPDRSVYIDYMDASGQMGIPTSFLVDGEGKIAWIGHPDGMHAPLSRMLGVEIQAADPMVPPMGDEGVSMKEIMEMEFLSSPEARKWIDKAAAHLLQVPVAWDYELSASILIGMSQTDLKEARLTKSGFMMRGGEAGSRQVASTFFKMAGLPSHEEDKTTIVLHEGVYYVDQESNSPMMGEIDGRISLEDAKMMKDKFAGPFAIPLQGVMFDPNPINADPGLAFASILEFCSLEVTEKTESTILLHGAGSPLLDMNMTMGGEAVESVDVVLELDASTGRPLSLKIGSKPENPAFLMSFSNYREVDTTDPSTIHGNYKVRKWTDLRAAIRQQMEMMQAMENSGG